MKKLATMLLCMSLFLLSVGLHPTELQAAAPYYEGKVLTIIVGHAPGGGYDRMSRLLARYLPKYIPGSPSVVVKQMTGGGTVIAANYVYNQAKPDGLTITALDRGIGTRQLLGLEGVKYDFTKYAWIGNVASEPTGLFLTTKLPYKTFNDVLKNKEKKLFIGASGFGNYTATLPLLLRDYLGINIEIVTYPEATATIMLAIKRGEAHGHYSAYSTYLPLFERGVVRPFLRGRAAPGIPEYDKLPIIDDLMTDKKAKGIVQIFSAVEVAARPYVAPPGTPDNIMKILRDAFANVSKDKDMLAEVEKQKMEYGFMSAEESLKIVNSYMSSPPDIVQAFKKYESEGK
jgi:tripartite-type tricarboxylate transporter receptor subunit TctC